MAPQNPPLRRSSRKRNPPQFYAEEAVVEKETVQEVKKRRTKSPVRKTKANNRRGDLVESPGQGRGKRARGRKGGKRGQKTLGIVDPDAGLGDDAFVLNKDGDVYDLMLNTRNLTKNVDMFCILQVLIEDDKYYFHTRSGNTGSQGEAETKLADTEEGALEMFMAAFEDHTGAKWEDREAYSPVKGMYEWLSRDHKARAKNHAGKPAVWQYYVDDGVDGKKDGWYDYTQDGSGIVEELFHEGSWNSNLNQRVVQSGTFQYRVDLSQMTQMNIQHPNHTIRHIRRKGPDGSITPETNTKGPSAKASQCGKSIGQGKVDSACQLTRGTIYDNYDVMLNQTNIGFNNNKFYVIQIVMCGSYYVFTKWGRVGEAGQTQCKMFSAPQDAIQEFKKKFRAKTGNNWEDREEFVAYERKYELVEMDSEEKNAPAAKGNGSGKYDPCTLDPTTQELVEFIFNEDMFKSAMSKMELDVNKMPLGKLSSTQIERGVEILKEIEDILVSGGKGDLQGLSSRFFQVIPHAFGRRRPPVINTIAMVQAKKELCDVLSDIEAAQEMLATVEQTEEKEKHPADVKYETLDAGMTVVDAKSEEYNVIKKYMEATMSTRATLCDVWEIDRHSEGDRFSAHEKLGNRRLLWHGTNVAVVAAILKGGLRIMPHSGGRVGRGIYLASENGKSISYVRPGSLNGSTMGIMFLVEAALGKEHHIVQDDWTLTNPPAGFDCIIAKGRQEPDPKLDTKLVIEGKDVVVPQGKPIEMKQYKASSFWQSEYLLYKESQQRIRYMLTVRF